MKSEKCMCLCSRLNFYSTINKQKVMSALSNIPSVGSANSNDGQPDNTDPSQYKILALTFNQDCTYDYFSFNLLKKIK